MRKERNTDVTQKENFDSDSDAAANADIDDVLQSLPSALAISWGYVKQQKRGPKGELSIKMIVDAAIAIADKDGLSAVSMNRVAQSLGYSAMSLYRYIQSKEDLILLMQEAVCAYDVPPISEDEDWREGLRDFVRVTASVFCAHPWFGDIPVSGVPMTPNHLQIVDWALRSLRNMPFNDYEKMSFVLLVSSYARSVGLIQRDMILAVRAGKTPEAFSGLSYTGALKQLVTADAYPDLHPVVESGVYTGENEVENTVGNDFDFGLERILDGIQVYLERKRL
ncbi:TetR/AcrR family transcriptional regulator [Paenibacillus sp. OV219]|uniref:TetR/AcrR family transcriptional regulator n=1 Tax=Paenibacillus sp. OV219 TaxID=1884377 RepID=UPI0008BB6E54|nr:TetR/AcrR family transcriptional regulator [Paenibacillus sp. OV219]SEO52436.1 transcriptional regulator, TetR family [Paenibacillus sp. OV219]